MGQARMESNGRSNLRQFSNPSLGHPVRDQINFIQHKHQMFMRRILGNVLLNHGAPRARHIPRINDVQYDIRTVHHLVKLSPNSLRLALEEQVVLLGMNPVDSLSFSFGQVGVLAPRDNAYAFVHFGVGVMRFLRRGEHRCITGSIVSRHGGNSFSSPTFVRLFFVFSNVVNLRNPSNHILLYLHPLPTTLSSKGVFKRLVGQQSSVVLTSLVKLCRIFQ
mmetsp:Transcript_12663/g.27300  ORF Transcript_12663/g.27300 Transcript_12663/m.27300 type:complete len:220 (-) Transcript_12663:512-1171(-)